MGTCRGLTASIKKTKNQTKKPVLAEEKINNNNKSNESWLEVVKDGVTAGQEHTLMENLHYHPSTPHQAMGLGP